LQAGLGRAAARIFEFTNLAQFVAQYIMKDESLGELRFHVRQDPLDSFQLAERLKALFCMTPRRKGILIR
jgi:hypothetical protein